MHDKQEQSLHKLSNKNPFRTMFEGKSQEAIPFMAETVHLAAKIEQVNIDQLLLYPEQISKALFNTKKVIGTDVILIPLDVTLFVQGGLIGASELFADPMTKNMLEAIRQLKAAREYVACSIPSPLILAQYVLGQQGLSDPEMLLTKARELCQEILVFLRVVGETRPDLIIVQEKQLSGPHSEDSVFELFDPIFASISYYNAKSALSVSGINPSIMTNISNNVNGIMLTQNSIEQLSLNELSDIQQKTGVCIGLELPRKIYDEPDLLNNFANDLKANFGGSGVFAYTMTCRLNLRLRSYA